MRTAGAAPHANTRRTTGGRAVMREVQRAKRDDESGCGAKTPRTYKSSKGKLEERQRSDAHTHTATRQTEEKERG